MRGQSDGGERGFEGMSTLYAASPIAYTCGGQPLAPISLSMYVDITLSLRSRGRGSGARCTAESAATESAATDAASRACARIWAPPPSRFAARPSRLGAIRGRHELRSMSQESHGAIGSRSSPRAGEMADRERAAQRGAGAGARRGFRAAGEARAAAAPVDGQTAEGVERDEDLAGVRVDLVLHVAPATRERRGGAARVSRRDAPPRRRRSTPASGKGEAAQQPSRRELCSGIESGAAAATSQATRERRRASCAPSAPVPWAPGHAGRSRRTRESSRARTAR